MRDAEYCGIFVKKEREYGIRTPFSVPEPTILIPAAKKTSADAIVTGLLSYDDIFLTEGCCERHPCESYVTKSAAPKLMKKSLLEGSI